MDTFVSKLNPKGSVDYPIFGLYNQLTLDNPTPRLLQLVTETDKLFCNGYNKTKTGDGVLPYNKLPYNIWEEKINMGTFLKPNNNTPIDCGSFLSPAVNFNLNFCVFHSYLK